MVILYVCNHTTVGTPRFCSQRGRLWRISRISPSNLGSNQIAHQIRGETLPPLPPTPAAALTYVGVPGGRGRPSALQVVQHGAVEG